ncbi:MAG: endolytic transglycosylase MltG [Oscillospiraceae bacterium]|nr:endolytic transglycosylase MltG [Oscillospiraceae bacterium]
MMGNDNQRNDTADIFADSMDAANDSYMDRSEKVRNFKVHIEEDRDVFLGDEYMSDDLPQYKGEIYFANHARKNNDSSSSGQQRQGENRTARTGESQSLRQPGNRANGSGTSAASRAQAQKNRQGRPKARRKGLIPGYAKFLAVIALCIGILSMLAITTLNDILAINKTSEPISVEIPENATTDQIITILGKNDLISRPFFCKTFYKVIYKMKKPGDKKTEYLSGIFYLKSSMGLEGMLNKLKERQNYSETITLAFPEGWTIYQIFNKLQKYKVCDAEYLYNAAKNVNFNYDFLQSAKGNMGDDRYLLLEGYMFPDTYEFFLDLNANSVIETFLKNFNDKWNKEYAEQAAKLGYSVDEIIKIASIIQREAANEEQMPLVSSVLHNRLRNYRDYPTLDCDSTYDYITNYVRPVVGVVLGDKFWGTYNTYICDRLPAGAICNPGEAAIRAALYPAETSYYFFQHDSKGKIYMAKTNAEHRNYKNQIALENAR